MRALLAYAVALGVLLAAPAMAQWVEQGDAGDLPGSAQVPVGGGPLATIAGTLDANDVDMYCIRIDDPAGFLAGTCNGASYDTQIFLFREDGLGIGMNDDACGLQSQIGAATTACPNFAGPGQYLLAVSRYNRDPVDAAGATLWLSGTAEHCVDGTGAANPVAGWINNTSAGGAYTIALAGVSYCGATAVEPSTWGSIKSIYR